MARTTASDCLQYVPNRYELVLVAAKRARQLFTGMAAPLVEDTEINEKPSVLSLREIGEGKINTDDISLLEEEFKNEPAQLDFESILRGFEEADREKIEQEEEVKGSEEEKS